MPETSPVNLAIIELGTNYSMFLNSNLEILENDIQRARCAEQRTHHMTDPDIQHAEMARHAGYRFRNEGAGKRTFIFFILHIKSTPNPAFTVIWRAHGWHVGRQTS